MGNCYKLGYSYSKKRIHELIHKGLKYEAETEQADIPNVTVKAIGIKISEEDKQSFEKRANQHFLKEELYQATKPTELTPIIKFNTNEELQSCLEWWQKRLGLQDWIIKGIITNELIRPKSASGENEFSIVNKMAAIRIRPYDAGTAKDWIAKQPQELVLVHELLHCVIYETEYETTESIELVAYNRQQHQLIDDMAKALIMTKYDIGLDYFRNF